MFYTTLLVASLIVPSVGNTPKAPTLLQSSVTLPANHDFVLIADHDGVNTVEYRVLRDKILIEQKPVSALVNGSLQLPQAGLPVGVYSYVVQAVNIVGTEVFIASSDTLTLTTQLVITGVFKVGDQIQVYSGTEHWPGAAVRSQPSMASLPFLGVHPAGVKGKVLEGPMSADSYFWVRVDYENSTIDGWSTETNLELVTEQPPPPVNCKVSEQVCDDPTWSECGSDSKQTRTVTCKRTVITPESNGGTCNDLLVETRPEVRSCTPLPIDPCVKEPITLSVTAWPTKNRKTSTSFSVFSPRTTNTTVTFTFEGQKSTSATATDGTCSVTVIR